ncbi:hypothetical protein EHW97_02440 [Aeromicrobium camelliae]|uniref:Mce-associated membrane protein n=1 Tax=Aeromicrobium camelliae TaxID=1538144 RepID=A0A3N6WQJ3_9ACTN|nr:hypothetical protein [Aeromicrobium camelliae]RQN09719.1 hypothetical protein EHW97_02440 [Aeromicrobium camelliae]
MSRVLNRWVLVGVLVAVGIAGWATAWTIQQNSAAQNAALVDAGATADVQAQVSQALTRVLSYDFNDPQVTEDAAEQFLSGDAREEYDTLYATLKEQAPDQELVLTAQVQVTGVKELGEDEAELLVFLDQASRRATDEEASVSAAQLAVTAERDGDAWTITGLEIL